MSEALRFSKGELQGRWWACDGANSVVVLCHGVHQHAGMYEDFAQRLHGEGFAVFGYDLRGFGGSAGERGMTAENAFEQAMVDLKEAVEFATKHITGKCFVFGHSLGGLVACLLATEVSHKVDGFLLSSPSVAVAPLLKAAHMRTVLSCLPGAMALATYELDLSLIHI